MIISWILGLLLVVLGALLVLLAVRWLRVLRVGGINVALRWRTDDSGRGWHLGIGRYRGDEFVWFRVLSLRLGANRVIRRDALEIDDRREPSRSEAYAMPADSTVLRCRSLDGSGGSTLEIAMGKDALTGFLSWLESAPPGRSLPWAS
ncbi:uncharacterized protein DUF2550 [Tamaricihabitans halophyticus]|uniref:Uncharacterized protein DUF2550 n=1 Tax=Tamaricihabitans halophyticus TaxID=1262583 RepID=A0A4R2QXC0_9PSEU|nr:DUF2550 domain-containing protein [Tamaricihabitans halophyticus]TCP54822.1 uncharacterized protein DUF2550 [Tamaricihabitans halophyticus]